MPAFKGRHVELLQSSTLREVRGCGGLGLGVQLGRKNLVGFQDLDFLPVPGMGESALIRRLTFDNYKTQEPSHPDASSPGEFTFTDLWPKAQHPPNSGLHTEEAYPSSSF